MNKQIKWDVNPVHPRKIKTLISAILLGSGVLLAAQAAAQPVVDQQPLTTRAALAPNIVLMLDDSGSMAWDFMPDLGYLTNNTNQGKRYSEVNGVYYNPSFLYTPPPKSDGTASYANSSFSAPWTNGFKQTGAANFSSGYYEYFPFTVTPTFSSNNAQQCPGNWDNNTNTCYAGFSTFAYTTTDSNGNYVDNYVVDDSKGYSCAKLTNSSNCHLASDSLTINGVTTTYGQNVANWFSYYRTRILMATSGLMSAFSDMDSSYRFGFGSINGRNVDGLPSPTYSFATSTNSSNKLSEVQPFGATRKTNFWNWLIDLDPNNGTPLRAALDGVGQYYETAQPWLTDTNPSTVPSAADSSNAYSCRQSYAILTTDGFWNGGNPSTSVGNADGNDGPTVTNSKGQSGGYVAKDPYQDSYDTTLADVAMYYWERDLQGGLANDVPTSTADNAFWQHMTTFTVGLGFKPEDANGTAIDMTKVFGWADGTDTSITAWSDLGLLGWPQPSGSNGGSINNIADLAHAGLNGHGGFYSASNPQAFASAIKSTLNQASTRVGTGASLAANSTKLDTDTYTYQASYYTQKWTGDLKAFKVSAISKTIVSPAEWSAGTELADKAATCTASTATNCDITSLDIKTINPSTGAAVNFSGSNFGNLDSALQTALGSADMVRYLRGNAAYEAKNGGPYRDRETPLGDIVDSQPVYVGRPDPNLYSNTNYSNYTFDGASDYFTWATNLSTASPSGVYDRWPMLYVASNDGMLHGFLATTESTYDNQGNVTATYPAGTQLFAYMPAAVIKSGVANLAGTNYGTPSNPHQYFNDGELTVADAYWSKNWHTVLVGTTGRGAAKAVYAIDITDPQNPQPLWERSAADGKANSGYIGQMVGKPLIVQTGNGSWSVLIGNGYNSANGVAALLQFNLQTGDLAVHTVTDNTDPATSAAAPNGLAAPASLDVNTTADGIQDIAYAGDLLGHVWRFSDLTAVSGNATTVSVSPTGVTKIFTTQVVTNPATSTSEVQPITAGMLAGIDPSTKYRWLFFGTGQYLNAADLGNKSTQTWYGIIANDGSTQTVGQTVSSLGQRTIVAQVDPTISTLGQRYFSLIQDVPTAQLTSNSGSVDASKGYYGWYMNLLKPDGNGGTVAEGERMVTPNQFQGSLLIGTSRIPDDSDPCNPSGRGWIMGINPFTGTNVTLAFMDINGDGVVDDQDSVTINGKTYPAGAVGFNALPNNPIFVGNTMLVSFDDGSTGQIQTSGGATSGGTRTSWREMLQQ